MLCQTYYTVGKKQNSKAKTWSQRVDKYLTNIFGPNIRGGITKGDYQVLQKGRTSLIPGKFKGLEFLLWFSEQNFRRSSEGLKIFWLNCR